MLYTIVKKCTDVDGDVVDLQKVISEGTAEKPEDGKKRKLLNIKSKV